jgi:Periplasmic binding protein domain
LSRWCTNQTHLARWPVFATLAVVIFLIAGCGSSSSSSTSSSSTQAAATNAANSSSASATSAAQAATAAAEKPALTLGVTTPLKSKPAAGKTFIWLSCEIPQCATIGKGVEAATAAAGWHYKQINYVQANPATLVAAMQQALAYHPVAVGLSGLPEAVWASQVPAYKKAGVGIVTFAVAPVTVTPPVIASIDGTTDNTKYGQDLANWTIADSGGKAHVLFVNVPTLTILNSVYQGYSTALKSGCPACKITVINETVPDAVGGQLTSATVSALRRDPSIGYAVGVDGAFFDGLPSALSAAGLSGKVKLAAQAPDTTNLASINAGNDNAFTGLASLIGGWQIIDSVLRKQEGMTISPGDGGLPTQLFVKGGHFTVSDSYNEPANYQAQFKKLWLVP